MYPIHAMVQRLLWRVFMSMRRAVDGRAGLVNGRRAAPAAWSRARPPPTAPTAL